VENLGSNGELILASDNEETFAKTIALLEPLGIISLMTNPNRVLTDGAKTGLQVFLEQNKKKSCFLFILVQFQ
jgi:hypothetical protein